MEGAQPQQEGLRDGGGGAAKESILNTRMPLNGSASALCQQLDEPQALPSTCHSREQALGTCQPKLSSGLKQPGRPYHNAPQGEHEAVALDGGGGEHVSRAQGRINGEGHPEGAVAASKGEEGVRGGVAGDCEQTKDTLPTCFANIAVAHDRLRHGCRLALQTLRWHMTACGTAAIYAYPPAMALVLTSRRPRYQRCCGAGTPAGRRRTAQGRRRRSRTRQQSACRGCGGLLCGRPVPEDTCCQERQGALAGWHSVSPPQCTQDVCTACYATPCHASCGRSAAQLAHLGGAGRLAQLRLGALQQCGCEREACGTGGQAASFTQLGGPSGQRPAHIATDLAQYSYPLLKHRSPYSPSGAGLAVAGLTGRSREEGGSGVSAERYGRCPPLEAIEQRQAARSICKVVLCASTPCYRFPVQMVAQG